MAISFRSLVENGGGDIAFLWHVAGYPWAVTNNAKLITALSNTADSTVQAARKRLFGSNEWTASGTVTPAYTVPIFPSLILDFGKMKYSLDESKGLLKGGDWQVKIEDRILGHTWQHAASGDEIWGLDGLHRVANVFRSSVHGWGYLSRALLRNEGGYNPAYVEIEEESGSALYNRVDACSGDEYVVIWLNGEAMAVNAVDGSFPGYHLTFTDLGQDGRGLYRSRKQDHFLEVFSEMNPIIADVPGGIDGKYCWLYGIPLVNDAIALNENSEPVIAEIDGGVISPNISTRDSVTKVRIRNKLSSLERTVNIQLSKGQETSMAGFIFSRGESGCVCGGTGDNILKYTQMPHFVIREYTGGWSDLYDALEDGVSKDNLIKPEWFEEKYIWICGKNETRYFDTADMVMQTLNKELQDCYNQSPDRFSEGTVLQRPYSIVFSGIQYKFRYTGEETTIRQQLRGDYLIDDYDISIVYPYITGPLTWVFALGVPIRTNCAYRQIKNNHFHIQYLETAIGASVADQSNAVIPYHPYYARWLDSWWMHEDTGNAIWDHDEVGYLGMPSYYYQHPWDTIPLPDTEINAGVLPETNTWEGHGLLFLPQGTDVDAFTDGEYITFGDGRWFPSLQTYVDEMEVPGDYTALTVMTPGGITTVGDERICRGASLFYLPLMEYWDVEDTEDVPQPDPHYIFKSADASAAKLSSILRAMLGENISGIALAKEIQISDNPFFTTIEGFISTIDWDSIDALQRINGQTYWLDMDEDKSIYEILKHEILLHCGHMTREWDDYHQMFMYRFRNLGPPSKNEAQLRGYHLDSDKALLGVPVETHGIGILYNAVTIKIGGTTFTVRKTNAAIVGTDSRRTLNLKPVISKFNSIKLGDTNFLTPTAIIDISIALTRFVNTVSAPGIEQDKGITTMQWLFPVGREIFVTDPTARQPSTHAIGLDLEPALVTEVEFDISKQKGSVNYRIGSTVDAETYGWAPACFLTTGNFSKSVGEWSGTPDDHKYTYATQPKDVYFFDCWNFPAGPDTPVARDCSCGDYKVWAHEVGTYAWTPLEFTCRVSAAGVITLYGDTTDIDEAENYIITFREWADLEDCQKTWCTHADDSNTIGAANHIAHRWV